MTGRILQGFALLFVSELLFRHSISTAENVMYICTIKEKKHSQISVSWLDQLTENIFFA